MESYHQTFVDQQVEGEFRNYYRIGRLGTSPVDYRATGSIMSSATSVTEHRLHRNVIWRMTERGTEVF